VATVTTLSAFVFVHCCYHNSACASCQLLSTANSAESAEQAACQLNTPQ